MSRLENIKRPRSIAQVVGQPHAYTILEPYIRNGLTKSLLLVGPTGCGKTSVARIVAQRWICPDGPHAPESCFLCDQLFFFGQGGGYFEVDAGRHGNVDYAKEIAGIISNGSNWNNTGFIDEAHNLDPAAEQALLKAAETYHSSARLIFATTPSEVHKISKALRSRCYVVDMEAISRSLIFGTIRTIAQDERIEAETSALSMIAFAAEGSLRKGVNLLEQVDAAGPVTAEATAKHLSRGQVAPLLTYLHSVIEGDLTDQDDALDAWGCDPGDKVKLIRDGLLHIYNHHLRPSRSNDVVNPALFLLQNDDRLPLVAGFKARAQRLGMPADRFFLEMVEAWDANFHTVHDRTSLLIKARRFNLLVGGDENRVAVPAPSKVGDDQSDLPSGRKLPFRGRSARHRPARSAPSGPSQRYLEPGQAENIYDMASFMTQHYGVLLNTSLDLDHGLLGTSKPNQASALVSQVTHELQMRVQSWSGGAAHWIYVYREEGGRLLTKFAMHIPAAALPRIEEWLTQRILEWCPEGNPDGLRVLPANPERQAGWIKNRVQRHWSLVRPLWGSVDPTLVDWDAAGTRRQPLIDLLRVARADRQPLGDIGPLRAIGGSRSLGPDKRKRAEEMKMELLSAFRDDAWLALESGWELKEHDDRRAETKQRVDAVNQINLEHQDALSALDLRYKETAMKALYSSWPDNPHYRPRAWDGWWAS